MGSRGSGGLERQGTQNEKRLFQLLSRQKEVWFPRLRGDHLTRVEDGGVDPALSVADGHPAAGVGEQDLCAASPGSRCHPVGVVTTPVPHQHAIIVSRIQLNTEKFDQPCVRWGEVKMISYRGKKSWRYNTFHL